MPKRLSEITDSIRELGEIQVTDWDLMGLLNKDLKDLEIGPSLRKLGNKKVMEWDFRSALQSAKDPFALAALEIPDPEEMQELIVRLRSFLHFVAMNLIDEPDRAEIRIQEIGPGVVRFKLVVAEKDLKTMLGRDGSTASAVRNLLKAAALAEGAHALLEIHSHEEDAVG